MASTIRHPLRPLCVITITVIALVLCLCVATCHSEDMTLSLSRNTEHGNSSFKGVVQSPKPSSASLPSGKKENGCHTSCHLTTKQGEDEGDEGATINKPELAERFNGSSRQTRSIPEDVQKNGHQRDGRAGALNKNFLRFGRGNLNKNFLRFGRGGNLKQNFLRFGRGGLQKNFLRFGRNDGGEYDYNSGEKSDLGVPEIPTNNEESTDLRSSIDTADNLRRAIERLRSEMSENEEENAEKQENGQSFAEVEADGSTAQGSGAFEMGGNGAKVKRGSLSNNFLRFGRNYKQNMFSGKRGSLNRNFLRFGKRSGTPTVDAEEGNSQESTGIKFKREVDFDTKAEKMEDRVTLPMQRKKKSVLFLANPWLNKNLSNHTKDQRSVHGDSIRRRSLDGKVISQLHNNFIRFGRR